MVQIKTEEYQKKTKTSRDAMDPNGVGRMLVDEYEKTISEFEQALIDLFKDTTKPTKITLYQDRNNHGVSATSCVFEYGNFGKVKFSHCWSNWSDEEISFEYRIRVVPSDQGAKLYKNVKDFVLKNGFEIDDSFPAMHELMKKAGWDDIAVENYKG